jgi:hypothetical protein
MRDSSRTKARRFAIGINESWSARRSRKAMRLRESSSSRRSRSTSPRRVISARRTCGVISLSGAPASETASSMAAGVALVAPAGAVAFLGGAARNTGLVSRISIVLFRAETSFRRRPRAIAARVDANRPTAP